MNPLFHSSFVFLVSTGSIGDFTPTEPNDVNYSLRERERKRERETVGEKERKREVSLAKS